MADIERDTEPKPSPEIGVVAPKASNNDLERASAAKPSPDDPEQDAATQTWWQRSQFEIKLIVALALPVFVETLDYTVVASAQGQIASAFGRLDLETWVGTSYVLTSTAFLPLCSNIADILGRHATLQFGFVMFFLGSVISTAAQNMATVLAGRGIAGIGAAFLLALVRVIMTDNRSLTTNMLRVAVLSLLFTIGYSTGPIIGGALSSVNFRWIFAINLPIALLGSILAFVTVRNDLIGPIPDARDNLPGWPTHTPTSRLSALAFQLSRIDWVGAFLFTSGAIVFLIGLSWGSTESWDEAKVIACLTVGGILVVACIVWEFYLGQYDVRFGPDGKTPILKTRADGTTEELKIPPRAVAHTSRMIPLWIFKNHQIPVVFFGAFTSGMVMFSGLYFLAVYWSIVAGFQNTKTGTQLVYLTPGIGGGVWVAAAMISWWRQPRFPIMLGQVVQAVGVGLLAKAISENSHGQINGFLAMCGAGIGFSMGTLEVQSRFLLPKEQNSLLTTMHLFFRTAGGTIGLAQLSAVLQSKLRSYILGLVKSGSLSLQDALTIAQGLASEGGKQSSGPGIAQLPENLQQVVRDAYNYGVKWSFYSLLPWCALSALAVFSLGNIVDTDRVERERKEKEKKERLMAEAEAEELEAEKKAHPANGRDTEGPIVDANGGATATTAAKKKKKPVGYGPRYRGPFMYLVYGIELLLGTRRRPPKKAKTGQPPVAAAAANNEGSPSSSV